MSWWRSPTGKSCRNGCSCGVASLGLLLSNIYPPAANQFSAYTGMLLINAAPFSGEKYVGARRSTISLWWSKAVSCLLRGARMRYARTRRSYR